MDSSFDEPAEPVAVAPARVPRLRLPRPRILEHDLAAPALALTALVLALATQFAIARDMDIPRVGLGFVAAGLLFGGAILSLNMVQSDEAAGASPFVLTRRWEIALLAGVILLAVFFRFFRFMEFPQGLWYDEAVNGTDALWIMDHDHLTVWRSSNFGHSTIYFYLLIASFKVFGYTVFAMRIVPALAGLAAVFAFYFLARWLTGPAPALVATALLAVSRYAVTFSRVSWEASLQPLLEIMAVYFFVRALETKSRFFFFMAGGSLAAGIYTYLAFRFVPFVMLFFLLYVAVTQWRLLRANVPGLAVYAASFIVVIAPLGQFAVRHQDLFLARTRAINVFNEIDEKDSYEPLRSNIEKTFKMMNVRGDDNGRHNLPKAPMLDGISAALLALGAAVSVWSIRNWRKGGMLGWLVLAVVPGAFTISRENPSAIRTIGAIPPMFLLIGLAVAVLYRSLAPTRRGLIVFGLLATALVGVSAQINYRDFFERQANNRQVYDSFQPQYTKIGQIAADHADDEDVLISGEFGHPVIQVLGRGKKFGRYDPTRDLVLPKSGKDALVILDMRQFTLIPTLQRLYPNLTQDDYVDPFARVWFTSVTIPAADIESLHQLNLTVREGSGPDGRVMSAGPSGLARDWTAADLDTSGTATAVWEGFVWLAQPAGAATVSASAPGDVAVELDGAIVAKGAAEASASSVKLSPGQHRLKVTATIIAPGPSEIVFRDDGGPSLDPLDAVYGRSAGDHGFQVIHHAGTDFAGQVLSVGTMPFASPSDPVADAQAIEYRGVFAVSSSGEYHFALDGGSSAQLFADDELVVDNGGSHGQQRAEGHIGLTEGQHLISIQYLATSRPDWALFMQAPDGEWQRMEGSEFDPPAGTYAPLSLASLKPDPAWPTPREYPEFDSPRAVTLLADGTALVASHDTLAFIDATGELVRMVKLEDGAEVADLATGPGGEIIVGDRPSKTLLVLDAGGDLIRKIDGPFASVTGIDVRGDTVYVASANGGFVYSVPITGGKPELLPMSEDSAPVRALQPSDVAVAPDGTFYLADFDARRIVISPDGRNARTVTGVAGVGVTLPHLAIYKKVLLVADPANQRVVMYDLSGKQRGVYVFPNRPDGTWPAGIAVSPDGRVYLADMTGSVHRLLIEVPADLDE